jgi:hypothetical protein
VEIKKGKEEAHVEEFFKIPSKRKASHKGNKPIEEFSKKDSNNFQALIA